MRCTGGSRSRCAPAATSSSARRSAFRPPPRSGSRSPSPSRTGGAVDAIETDGEERLDAEPLVVRLKALVRAEAAAPQPPASGGRTLRVVATLGGTAEMPAVRAFQLLQALAAHGRIVRSVPAEE